MESLHTPDKVRARLTEDAANGKTVVLSTRELDNPTLREQLPAMLEELSRSEGSDAGGPPLPGYTMLGEIGQGGMSTVFLARHNALGRHVAVKVAPKWLGGGERARERLVQEAQAMARVQHPNIVVIHDIIDVDDTFAIAMEWIDGRTLASLLRALPGEPDDRDMTILCTALGTTDEVREQLDTSTTRHFTRLIYDMACATQAVHDAGLLHLDIKPSNVLVRRDGTPLLADFGVVREISPQLTQTRTFAGTPVYSAPEQLRRDDAAIGPHSDVYSLGLTLYESLARSQPLRALDLPGIVECVESGSMPRLSEKCAVTPDLENIVHKAIAPEPEHRYATAAELADDLLAFLEHRPVKARPLTKTQRVKRWMRNEPWKAALAVTLAVMLPILGALGAYLVVQMPAIIVAEEAARLEQANRLKQEVYQRWMTNKLGGRMAIATLERAMELDPGDTSLACLLAIANEQGWQILDEVCAEHEDAIERNPALQMLANKARARRSFFLEDEVTKLSSSPEPINRYVLALDRVFHAHDLPIPDSVTAACRAIEDAIIDRAPDPLLLGLLAWFCQRSKDHARYTAVVQAMWRTWPEDATVLTWASLAVEPFDYGEARRHTEAVIARTPKQERGYEVLCGALIRHRSFDEIPAVLELARKNGAIANLEPWALLARSRQGDPVASERFLEQFDDGELTALLELAALRVISEDRYNARVDEILNVTVPSPEHLVAAMNRTEIDSERAERAWDLVHEHYPDRMRSHFARVTLQYQRRDLGDVSELAKQYLPLPRQCNIISPLTVRALIRTQEWEHLFRHADHWHRYANEPSEAAYYRAMARLRQGDLEGAAKDLALVTFQPPPKKKSWYADALLEAAWVHGNPDGPPLLRNIKLARLRLDEFERRNRELKVAHSGPWTQLVRGWVLYSSGDRDAGRQAIERGLRRRLRRETHCPPDVKKRLRSALEHMTK